MPRNAVYTNGMIMGSNNTHDFIFLSYIIYLCYYHRNNNNTRVLNITISNPSVFVSIYNDFVNHHHARVEFVRRLYTQNLKRALNLTPKYPLFRLIKGKKIDAVCRVTNYLAYIKSTSIINNNGQKLLDLYNVLEEFIRWGGAVIINDRKIHRYMNLKPGNSWRNVLQDNIFK